MHQPGVVPLRPLTLGDMFGGALQTMRRNPEATIGMGLVVLAVLLVPSLLLTLWLTRSLNQLQQLDLEVITLGVNGVLALLASIALTGMIVHVIGEAVLGDRVSLGATWRAVRPRIPALVGSVLIITVMFTVLMAAAVLAGVLIVLGTEGTGAGPWGILAVVLGGLALLVLSVWAGCRLSLAPAAVVLERVGPWRGIVRAWQLTRGGQSWRVVGITLLAGIITSIFAAVIQVPVTGILFYLFATGGMDISTISPTYLLTDHLLQLVVGALTTPFTAGVTALLYLDQRIRREGLDVTLVRTAQDRAAARGR